MFMDPLDPFNAQWHGYASVLQMPMPGGPVGKSGWWTFLWCHDRCHKPEKDERRMLIRSVITSVGGKLKAVNKAEKALAFAQNYSAFPQVWITEWRHAKPLMLKLQDMDDCPRPWFTLVMCSCERQLLKASKWAQMLPPNVGEVYTCTEDNVPSSLLGGIIQQCFIPLDDCINGDADDDEFPCEATNKDSSSIKDDGESSEKDKTHELPDVDFKTHQCLKAADEDRDDCLSPIRESMAASLYPVNIPTPVALISGCEGSLPRYLPAHLTMENLQ